MGEGNISDYFDKLVRYPAPGVTGMRKSMPRISLAPPA